MYVGTIRVILVDLKYIFPSIAQKNSQKKRLDEFSSSLKFKCFYHKCNLKKKILKMYNLCVYDF